MRTPDDIKEGKRKALFHEFIHAKSPKLFLIGLFWKDEAAARWIVRRFFKYYEYFSEYKNIKTLNAAIDHAAPLWMFKLYN